MSPQRRANRMQSHYNKKARGRCTRCPAPSSDDLNLCAKHRESERLRQRNIRNQRSAA